MTSSSNASDNILQQLFPCNSPRHPDKSSFRDRLVTFLHVWPIAALVKPYEIAKAGFFSIAVGDKVKCYYCNGGLQNWRGGDDPWLEHAKWYPNCEFLLRSKGIEYVSKVSMKYPDLIRPELIPSTSRQQSPPPTTSNNFLTCRSSISTNHQVAQRHPEVRADSFQLGSHMSDNEDLYGAPDDEEHIPSPTSSVEYAEAISRNRQLSEIPNLSLVVDAKACEEEIKSIQQEKRCKVCLDRDTNCVLQNCGHVCCCTECAVGLRVCPICRSRIDKAYKFYR